ncbi:hypothetical protein PMAYCL1PPCAC_19810, partial [Pristionchus mayeri]
KVQVGMECASERSIYDISDVVEMISSIPSVKADEEDEEVDALVRQSLCDHAICLRDLSFVVEHTQVFMETNKKKLLERAPLDKMWKEEGEEDDEEEGSSPTESPIGNHAMTQGIFDFMQRRLLEQLREGAAQAVNESLISSLPRELQKPP